jgi:hypothetical protein
MEGVPSPCFNGAEEGKYAKTHNPFIHFNNVRNDPARCRKIVSFTQLRSDLDRHDLPTFGWITPDNCHNSHDCSMTEADTFLSKLVPTIQAQLGPHGILMVVWDEGTTDAGCCGGLATAGRTPLIVVGPDVAPGTVSNVPMTHYSMSRGIAELFNLPLLGLAGDPRVTPISSLFRQQPNGQLP